MLNAIKKLFGIKPSDASVPAESAPYKIDPIPAGTEASIIASAPTALAVEAAVVEQAPAKKASAKRGPAKPKEPAVKKPRAPKAV